MRKSSSILAGAVSALFLAGTAQIATAIPAPIFQWDPSPDATASAIGAGYTVANNPIVNSSAGINHGGSSLLFNDGSGGTSTLNGVATNRSFASVTGSDGSFTMAAFVNLNSDAASSSDDNIIFGTDNSNPLHLGFRNGQIQYGFWANDFTQGTAPAVGAWHQITFTFDGSTGTQTAYLDGSLVFSQTGKAGYANGGNLTIGTNGGNNGDFDGYIGDVQVYNSALSQSDVATLFTTDSQPAPEPAALGLLGLGALGLLVRRRRA